MDRPSRQVPLPLPRAPDTRALADRQVDPPAAVNRAELIAAASPPCHECGEPVQRVETRWHIDEDGAWRPGPYYMVCAADHRVIVEAIFDAG